MQNTKYIQFNLSDLIQQRGEVYVKSLLSSFSCPLNPDVEDFLKNKAILFSQRGFAKTHLVFWSSQDYSEIEFVGYYSLAQKSFTISKKSVSNKIYGHLKQYGTYDSTLQKYVISSILIGQLGKNFADGNDTLISGAELLQLAINKVRDIQYESGGRYTYLECEDFPYLLEFYKINGFTEFGKRQLDPDETNIKGTYLLQFVKKI